MFCAFLYDVCVLVYGVCGLYMCMLLVILCGVYCVVGVGVCLYCV